MHGQHFLLKAGSRTLSLREIFTLTKDEAHEIFKNLRWKDGVPVCPRCGCKEHYFIKSHKRFQCKECRKQFTVTSNTIFSSHKLELNVYLATILIFTNAGISMLQLSRDLDVQYKTAFVLAHKIRESIMNHKDKSLMEGEIEIDGAYFGGYVKPANRKENRIDRRLAENKKGNQRCVLALRQRGQRGQRGASRTAIRVVKTENQSDVESVVKSLVTKGSTIHADENVAYDLLYAKYSLKRVNHSKEYFNIETKACTNQAESFFSRMKRSYIGQHHKWSVEYLAYYATELAYKEDMRRVDNGGIFKDLTGKGLSSPISDRMCGYWQKNKKSILL